MKMSCLFSVAGALVLAMGLSGVLAQEPTTSREEDSTIARKQALKEFTTSREEDSTIARKQALKEFTSARNQRSTLLNEIERLEKEIQRLQLHREDVSDLQDEKRTLQSSIKRSEEAVARAKQELETAAPDAKKELQVSISQMERSLSAQKARLDFLEGQTGASPALKDLDDAIKKKEQERNQRRRDLAETENKINEFLNFELPRQSFKLWMSATFAVLVGLVIIGFFFIAWGDERVRQAIFSGAAGIQFVTLFSLVIAIILFGIIEILEGKELAALLGGLSGYILGRATSEHASAQPEQPSRDQRAPLGTQPQSPGQAPPAQQPRVGNGAAQHAQL